MTAGGTARTITLERGSAVPVSFAPGETMVELDLVRAAGPIERRPDLGIGRDDVAVRDRRVTLTVHSVGAQPTTGGAASLVYEGLVVARATIPPLTAPTDLQPRTTKVTMALPAGINPREVEVAVALPDDAPEITRRNNRVRIVAETSPAQRGRQ